MERDRLLADVEAFIDRHAMADSTFGRGAMNDWKLVRMMRAGRRIWPENEKRIRDFMADYDASNLVPAGRTVGTGASIVACDRGAELQRARPA